MSELLASANRAATGTLACAWTAVGAGILMTDVGGQVTFANPLAMRLFVPLEATQFSLRALLGLCGATGFSELVLAAEAGTASRRARIALADGRMLDGCSQPLAEGGAVVTLFEVTDYVRSADAALLDSLTGLLSRAGFHRRLREALAEMQRTGLPLAVVYIDLDKFKLVNDTLGHPVGDALLVKVAERLRTVARSTDVVARLGGDEFVILQAGQPQPQGAEALASRLVDLVGRTYIAAGHMVTVGASAGIAIAPADAEDAETLLKHADQALYSAKTGGRGRFRFFQRNMDLEMQCRRLLEIDLRKALALKEFELFYQPQVELESDRLSGFEALIRWRSPSRGLVSPATFIPLAEEIGLIGRIGDWVLHTACKDAASWDLPLGVAVNVSATQIRGGKLGATVASALAGSGLDPSRLELEITESSLLEDTENVLHVLQEIKRRGVRISMDDFGTGYSSLSYLQKFPFDKIKIDQSFVQKAVVSAGSGAIVRAVVALGASLGMKTIAEGVETVEQLERVRADGCVAVQGYLTGRPLPVADAASLIRGTLPNQAGDT